MDRLSHPDTPPLRLLERRVPRSTSASAPAPAAPGERLQAWLRRLVPSR